MGVALGESDRVGGSEAGVVVAWVCGPAVQPKQMVRHISNKVFALREILIGRRSLSARFPPLLPRPAAASTVRAHPAHTRKMLATGKRFNAPNHFEWALAHFVAG